MEDVPEALAPQGGPGLERAGGGNDHVAARAGVVVELRPGEAVLLGALRAQGRVRPGHDDVGLVERRIGGLAVDDEVLPSLQELRLAPVELQPTGLGVPGSGLVNLLPASGPRIGA